MTDKKRTSTPPQTDHDRELRLYNLTLTQVEKQLEEGTASSQIVSHFLSIGSEIAKTQRKQAELNLLYMQQKLANEKAALEGQQDLKQLLSILKGYKIKYAEEDDYDDYDD